jgi:hypothetical protein
MTALHSSNINLKQNEDSASVGIAQELQKINDYLIELHRNSNYFSSGTEILASKLLQSLTPTASTDYSLWKTTKTLKQVTKSSPLRTPYGTWARSATEKASVFQPYPSGPTSVAEETILQLLETPYQLEPSNPRLTRTDIQPAINNLNPKKIPRLRSHHR